MVTFLAPQHAGPVRKTARFTIDNLVRVSHQACPVTVRDSLRFRDEGRRRRNRGRRESRSCVAKQTKEALRLGCTRVEFVQ